MRTAFGRGLGRAINTPLRLAGWLAVCALSTAMLFDSGLWLGAGLVSAFALSGST